MLIVRERIRRHNISNVVYLDNMATQTVITKAVNIVDNIVKRNPNIKMSDIVKHAQKHFDYAYPNASQVRGLLKRAGYTWTKTQDGFCWVKTDNGYSPITRTCMRCDEKKLEKRFRKMYLHAHGDIGFNNRLVICNDCIAEEESITGESKAELYGIYAYLQQRYGQSIDKSMYKKFWEVVLR